ncbi:MAG: isoprenylcysteine carboxylmethyltransferase family protein [Candidatus Sungiibacteriota bacterium]
MNYIKTISVNLIVLATSFVCTGIALFLDGRFGLMSYASSYATILGLTLILYGFFFRLWASYTFYRNNLEVLNMKTQQKFITEGPYQYSRNPLYVGIVAISFGFVIYAGSIMGFVGAALIPLLGWHLWIVYREEKGLEQKFGDDYRTYQRAVPRWIGIKALLPLGIVFLAVITVVFGLAFNYINPREIFSFIKIL